MAAVKRGQWAQEQVRNRKSTAPAPLSTRGPEDSRGRARAATPAPRRPWSSAGARASSSTSGLWVVQATVRSLRPSKVHARCIRICARVTHTATHSLALPRTASPTSSLTMARRSFLRQAAAEARCGHAPAAGRRLDPCRGRSTVALPHELRVLQLVRQGKASGRGLLAEAHVGGVEHVRQRPPRHSSREHFVARRPPRARARRGVRLAGRAGRPRRTALRRRHQPRRALPPAAMSCNQSSATEIL